MKTRKILAPLVGLATVATLAAPIATSCTSKAQVSHIKSSPIDEIISKNGIAQYLLILDRNDYDINGFKVNVKVADNDKTGAVSQEFKTSWIVDGDHLIVNVQYLLTEQEAPEEDCTVKLDLIVSYGSQWKETVAVKFAYQAVKGIELTYYDEYGMYATEEFNVIKGGTYTLVCNYVIDIRIGDPIFLDFYNTLNHEVVAFSDITVSLDGKQLVKDVDYKFRYKAGNLCAVSFPADKHPKVNSKLTFKFIEAQATTTCRARLYNNAA